MKIKTIKDIKKFVERKNKSFIKKVSAEGVLDILDELVEMKLRELERNKLRFEKVKIEVKNKDYVRIPVIKNGYQIAVLKELRGY
jgi:transcription antitermination factor NusA-like protein